MVESYIASRMVVCAGALALGAGCSSDMIDDADSWSVREEDAPSDEPPIDTQPDAQSASPDSSAGDAFTYTFGSTLGGIDRFTIDARRADDLCLRIHIIGDGREPSEYTDVGCGSPEVGWWSRIEGIEATRCDRDESYIEIIDARGWVQPGYTPETMAFDLTIEARDQAPDTWHLVYGERR